MRTKFPLSKRKIRFVIKSSCIARVRTRDRLVYYFYTLTLFAPHASFSAIEDTKKTPSYPVSSLLPTPPTQDGPSSTEYGSQKLRHVSPDVRIVRDLYNRRFAAHARSIPGVIKSAEIGGLLVPASNDSRLIRLASRTARAVYCGNP